MKSALMAVAITALIGGLVIGPVTQPAEAQVYGGLKGLKSTADIPTSGTNSDRGEVILVGRGGRGGGGGGRGGGGRSFGGGGHGGKAISRGGGRGHYDGKGHKGKNYGNYHRGHNNRYYRYGRYRSYGWYAPYAYGYGYGNCAWLRQQALITGSSYWWNRYYACTY